MPESWMRSFWSGRSGSKFTTQLRWLIKIPSTQLGLYCVNLYLLCYGKKRRRRVYMDWRGSASSQQTRFLIKPTTAQIILEQERAIYLRSEEDVKVFLEALNNPPEPNSALQNAAYWHKCLFGATETE